MLRMRVAVSRVVPILHISIVNILPTLRLLLPNPVHSRAWVNGIIHGPIMTFAAIR